MKLTEIVALSGIVLGCVGYGIVSREAPKKIPSHVWHRNIDVIDVDSLELVEVEVGPFERRFKTLPESCFKITPDGRTVTIPVVCKCCNKFTVPISTLIPQYPDELDAYNKQMMDFTCVKCGGYVYRDVEEEEEEVDINVIFSRFDLW